MTLGKKIQILRQKKHWSQKELAEKLNIATGTLQQYELDKREPKLLMINKIAKILNVPIDLLVSSDLECTENVQENLVGEIYCNFCHFLYSPYNKYQVKEHREYHKKVKRIIDKFGFLLSPKEAENLRDSSLKIIHAKDSTENEIFIATTSLLKAEFSESLYSSNLDINHIDFCTFCRYELNQAWATDVLPAEVYFRLIDEYKDPPLQQSQYYPVCCYKEDLLTNKEEIQQKKYLESSYNQLNFAGREKAIELIRLLTKIPDYLTEEEIAFRKIPESQ